MRVLISDSSCLIDLRKASLLETFIQLPYELVIPDILFERELINFSEAEKKILQQGVRIESLPGEGVERAIAVNQANVSLSLNDCFALVIAERTTNSILLAGDRKLRIVARETRVEVHGILWVVDEMFEASLATAQQLHGILLAFRDDPLVRLPRNELARRIERFSSML